MTDDTALNLAAGEIAPGEWGVLLTADGAGTRSPSERRARIEERLYDCLDAILDGRLAERFPQSRGANIRIQVQGAGVPAAEIAGALTSFADGLARIPRYRAAMANSPFATSIAFEPKIGRSLFMSAVMAPLKPIRTVVAFAHHYERHLSAASMVGGYAFDSYSFGRIDHATTHIVFLAYLLIAGIAIAISQRLEAQPPDKQPSERTRTILTAITQFALGCLLSGFCVFYLRSASLWASWPYLLVLGGIFVGNEFLKKYTTRFTLSLLLYFFALFSYAILTVPVVIAMMGTIPFVVSGILALVLFWFYADLLNWLGHARWRQVRLQVFAGVLAIFAALNAFYFLKVLPPLPLALADAGVYHAAKKVGNVYQVAEEPQPWTTWFGERPIEHINDGDRIYLYAAVFAPGRFGTTIVHRWEWFDPLKRQWLPQSKVAFAIHGGRDAGYRAYSFKNKPKAGDWRVNITTTDGRMLGRIRFAIAFAQPPQPLVNKVLQ